MVLVFYIKTLTSKKGGHEKLLKLAQECLDKNGHKKAVSKLLAEVLGKDSKEVYKTLSGP